MVAKNDITGDSIQTKSVNNSYRNNYDLIFGKESIDNSGTDKNEYYDILSTEDCLIETTTSDNHETDGYKRS